MTPAFRSQHWVRSLSLAGKIMAVIVGLISAALLLACAAGVGYDSVTARGGLTRDLGMLADVVGATRTEAVSFGDARAVGEMAGAVAVKKHMRTAAFLRAGPHALAATAGGESGDPTTLDAAQVDRAAEGQRLTTALRAAVRSRGIER